NETVSVGGVVLTPFTSAHAIWYFVAAVSVLAAVVGLFGMASALAANRTFVKTFEAFYVLSLFTQFALIIWALVWCKQNQSQFDLVCTASQSGQLEISWIPNFASSWSCQKIYTIAMVVLGVGGCIWLSFNFFMTNRVIHYARELFEQRENRYKILGEAATKELDREQQIPLNYTNVGGSTVDQENNQQHGTSYRDEIEYRNFNNADVYQHPRTSAAEYNAGFGQGFTAQQQHGHYPFQQQQPQQVAPGFSHRNSAHGLDLVNPYYGEHQDAVVPPGPVSMATTPHHLLHTSSSSFTRKDTEQSFTHTNANQISSPFEDDYSPPAIPISTVPTPINTMQDIKVPLPPSPLENTAMSPTGGSGSGTAVLKPVMSPTSPNDLSSSGDKHVKDGGAYPF
ncbi:hypothetical protein BGZ83_002683, partial [Gryganskiella cystojenkinii]